MTSIPDSALEDAARAVYEAGPYIDQVDGNLTWEEACASDDELCRAFVAECHTFARAAILAFLAGVDVEALAQVVEDKVASICVLENPDEAGYYALVDAIAEARGENDLSGASDIIRDESGEIADAILTALTNKAKGS